MLPETVDDLSPEFVTAALQVAFPDVRVQTCRVMPQTSGRGLASALVRVHLDGEGNGLPATLIAKSAPSDPGLRAQLNAMEFFDREVCFYRTLAATTPVDIPACYFAEHEPETGNALLLLEDLFPARNGDSVVGATVDEVTAVLLALARMHARWWQHPAVAEPPWSRQPSMLAPAAVAGVFERSWPSFLSRLTLQPGHDLATSKGWISAHATEAATKLFTTGPRTLVHNDIQADNLFFGHEWERPVIFIDWQLATYGRCVVDVASAIRSMLQPPVRRQVEPGLLRLYHEALGRAGVRDYPFSQCQGDYDLATVLAPARLASAVGLHPGLRAHPGAPWNEMFLRLSDR